MKSREGKEKKGRCGPLSNPPPSATHQLPECEGVVVPRGYGRQAVDMRCRCTTLDGRVPSSAMTPVYAPLFRPCIQSSTNHRRFPSARRGRRDQDSPRALLSAPPKRLQTWQPAVWQLDSAWFGGACLWLGPPCRILMGWTWKPLQMISTGRLCPPVAKPVRSAPCFFFSAPPGPLASGNLWALASMPGLPGGGRGLKRARRSIFSSSEAET